MGRGNLKCHSLGRQCLIVLLHENCAKPFSKHLYVPAEHAVLPEPSSDISTSPQEAESSYFKRHNRFSMVPSSSLNSLYRLSAVIFHLTRLIQTSQLPVKAPILWLQKPISFYVSIADLFFPRWSRPTRLVLRRNRFNFAMSSCETT